MLPSGFIFHFIQIIHQLLMRNRHFDAFQVQNHGANVHLFDFMFFHKTVKVFCTVKIIAVGVGIFVNEFIKNVFANSSCCV